MANKLDVDVVHSGSSSGRLVATAVPAGANPRTWLLNHMNLCSPPWISSSDFISRDMIEHLMRNKEDLAIATKTRNMGSLTNSSITNMEGMLHTFVVPIVQGHIHGDYEYTHGHSMRRFPDVGKNQQARPVLISALIHPDFENREVFWRLCSLNRLHTGWAKWNTLFSSPIRSRLSLDQAASIARGESVRSVLEWDNLVQNQTLMRILHVTNLERWRRVQTDLLDPTELFACLEQAVESKSPWSFVRGKKFKIPNSAAKSEELSLEILFAAILEQIKNELSALEYICQKTGYNYTFSPAVIFRHALGQLGRKLMMLVHAAALREFSLQTQLSSMRIYAYSDFESPEALGLIKTALRGQKVLVMSKDELFAGREELYSPPPEHKSAMLVLHNNSDAFGQNIEFEQGMGSLDAAMGRFSSAAASLQRDREDLLTDRRMMYWPSSTLHINSKAH